MLVERVVKNTMTSIVHVQLRASKSPLPGSKIRLADAFDVTVGERAGEFFTLHFPGDVFELIENTVVYLCRRTLIMKPMILTNSAIKRFILVYQVRSPHPLRVCISMRALLERCKAKGINLAFVTLHVGAGTFQPVRTEDLSKHDMHSEWYTVPEETVAAVRATKANGNKVICVGTTSMRAIESASQSGQLVAGSGDTRLFITPGYVFKTVDRLVTNFHLPKSTPYDVGVGICWLRCDSPSLCSRDRAKVSLL